MNCSNVEESIRHHCCFFFRIKFVTENGTEALEISDLELDDEAQYTCKIGDRESSAKMMVEKGENNWHLLKE